MKMTLMFAIFLSSTCIGQMQNMGVDASKAMKNVSKVAVYFNVGAVAGVRYLPDSERAKKQISEKLTKQKLQLVASSVDADLILVVTEYNTENDCLADEIKVFKGGRSLLPDDSPIWSTNDSCGVSWPLNRAMDKFGKALKR